MLVGYLMFAGFIGSIYLGLKLFVPLVQGP